ncbi:unnamed protein product [Effrenium voratum]|nr:unnamed protein product [Effrenium voratum]
MSLDEALAIGFPAICRCAGYWPSQRLVTCARWLRELLPAALDALKTNREGLVLVVGGHQGRGFGPHEPLARAEIWPSGACAGPRQGRSHSACCALQGAVYVLGGRDAAEQTLTSVEVWDLHGWRSAPSLGWARHSAAAAALGGVLCIFGGFDGLEALDSAEGMDSCAISPEFAPLPPLTFPRGKHAAVALQKGIYLMGGMDSGYRCLACAWRLSWPLDAWRPLPPLRRERSECAAAAANGRAVVVAGGVANGWTTLGSAERYDPSIGQWEELSPMRSIRRELAAISHEGQVYVLGGVSFGGRCTAKVECLCDGEWQEVTALHDPRCGLGAAAEGPKLIKDLLWRPAHAEPGGSSTASDGDRRPAGYAAKTYGTPLKIFGWSKRMSCPVDPNHYIKASAEQGAQGKWVRYTYTDEAPMLATHAFYPIVQGFCAQAKIPVQLKDISVAGRLLSQFPEYLTDAQREEDILSQLGELAKSGKANIIKLPNVSASLPQLKECIAELQGKGYQIPSYPEDQDPKDDKEKEIKARYAKALGSAVNPVLREGNSDRRAAVPVKEYAFKYPHSMGKWLPESKTHVSSMEDGDFYSHEKSVTLKEPCEVRIEHLSEEGKVTVLKDKLALQKDEVLDASFMNCKMLRRFYEEQIAEAKEQGVLFSLHLKATMMKVSDPIMFGHCVKAYFKDVFEKYAATFEKLGVNANNGLGDLYKKIAALPDSEKAQIEADLKATYERQPRMAMVDSHKGITNLHVPSDIIIDNSMPTAIRAGGKMWDADDTEQDFKATIPDRSYAGVFSECVEFCKQHGAFDPKTMGACPNVGLMAQKAEEYGSHPTTFEAKEDGTIRIVDIKTGAVLLGHRLHKGDIWRSCQTKDDAPIKDWVKLAVHRCRENNFPKNDRPCKAIFWLDPARAHDCNIISKVLQYLPDFDTKNLDLEILSPAEAMRVTCLRAKEGLNTITVTGNVLRDYLTDLFPILELGTSAKMLSIVPMLAGGGMYETGAGGSAPKHVQQFTKEGHLRWDSLGEYLALSESIQDLAREQGNSVAAALGSALDKAVGTFLSANKNPSRKVKEMDNRGSHYWIARYWAEELAKQDKAPALQQTFAEISRELLKSEETILKDLIECQGSAVDIGGYYRVDKAKADRAMNPSQTLNSIIQRIAQGPDAKL